MTDRNRDVFWSEWKLRNRFCTVPFRRFATEEVPNDINETNMSDYRYEQMGPGMGYPAYGTAPYASNERAESASTPAMNRPAMGMCCGSLGDSS